jgi:hypothetical protein
MFKRIALTAALLVSIAVPAHAGNTDEAHMMAIYSHYTNVCRSSMGPVHLRDLANLKESPTFTDRELAVQLAKVIDAATFFGNSVVPEMTPAMAK